MGRKRKHFSDINGLNYNGQRLRVCGRLEKLRKIKWGLMLICVVSIPFTLNLVHGFLSSVGVFLELDGKSWVKNYYRIFPTLYLSLSPATCIPSLGVCLKRKEREFRK